MIEWSPPLVFAGIGMMLGALLLFVWSRRTELELDDGEAE